MQRLYSMFPQRGPGIGLLLLRLCVAGMLLEVEGAGWMRIVLILAAACIALGAFTTIAGVLGLLSAAFGLLGAGGFSLLASVGLALLMALILLGPGAYSIDARLFGRRELTLPSDPPADK